MVPEPVLTVQRYAMKSLDNLQNMDRCAACGRELESTWKFCIYCGRPLVIDRSARAEAIPSAIRADYVAPQTRERGTAFWVAVGIGILGVAVIIFLAVRIFGSHV